MLGKVGAIPVHFHGLSVTSNQGTLKIELFESPTVSANGTPYSPKNRNRISTRISSMAVFTAPTITSDGTKLMERIIPQVGGGAHESGGDSGVVGEWVLKPNTDYIIKITNEATSTTTYGASFFYYEIGL